MKINPGDIVTVRHYSGTSPFRSIILESEDNVLTVKLTKEFVIFNFFEGDPVVVVYESHGEIYTASCNLSSVNTRQGTIILDICNIEQSSDKRKTDRYPVSIYADVRVKGQNKKNISSLKNISYDGMMICTKAQFELDQNLELDLYIDQSVIFLKAEVAWKVQSKVNFEYGLKTVYPSLQTKNQVKKELENLKLEQEDFLRSLK